MREATDVAQEALEAAVNTWTACGLAQTFSNLATAVWETNLDRHEPELGDDATTLGTLCARNLANLIEQRVTDARGTTGPDETAPLDVETTPRHIRDVDVERADDVSWRIPGLSFSKPKGALRLSLGSCHFYVMKAPMALGRVPEWNSMVNWETESDTRHRIAQNNTEVLDNYYVPEAGQGALWSHMTARPASALRDFLLVWAGEPSQRQTAGWLTLPGLGGSPFIARKRLWWDDADGGMSEHGRLLGPQGPSFDEKPSVAPAVTLRPRPGGAGQG